ncbi:hypothetical protein [Aquibacillus saliphilus]|uniref:hypothetical protein n=1 Tax=Aquibacillus saliphilus TaxID=1909422 RepID=UPI001CEFE69F|nr:hypothetical protein [Aquibacillus saliphilus]
MRQLDWYMIIFVGTSLVHDFWTHFGLPQMYYWDVKRNHSEKFKDDGKKAA